MLRSTVRPFEHPSFFSTWPGKTFQASFSEEGVHTTFLDPGCLFLSIDRFLNCVLTHIPEQIAYQRANHISKSLPLYNYIIRLNMKFVKYPDKSVRIAARGKSGSRFVCLFQRQSKSPPHRSVGFLLHYIFASFSGLSRFMIQSERCCHILCACILE